ncbi:hypothetical protein O3P69_014183 [Scylla paramamosain]|uniref:Uncharacterized protein n=1 Tax=Scylla paramamosain TaxID=85552 RepID=A0AAW0SGP3_SCYPA
MATLRSGKQVGGSDGGGSGSGGEVDGRDRGAVQAADIKEKRNARTSKVLFGSLILDLLGLKVVLPVSSALLDCYSKHNTSGLYSSQLSCESLPEGRRRRDIGASLTEAWEVINPRALFSVSCVKGLGREVEVLHHPTCTGSLANCTVPLLVISKVSVNTDAFPVHVVNC